MTPETPDVQALKQQAEADYLNGRFQAAIQTQRQLIDHLAAAGQDTLFERKLLTVYLFNLGDYAGVIHNCYEILKITQEDPEIFEHLGIGLSKRKRLKEAVPVLNHALKLAPTKANIHDSLTAIYAELKKPLEARYHGEKSLLIKDQQATQKGKAHDIAVPIPDFRYDEPDKHIIAFSLWGDQPRYLQGALKNVALAPEIFPGWRCRFYCDDSVPPEVTQKLTEGGAEIVKMPAPKTYYDGLFWRFQVVDDRHLKRYLVRDCDAVLNTQERVAVDAWIDSRKHFHLIRDFYSHSELILAGLWGGVGGALPSLATLRSEFQPATLPSTCFDQLFLREAVWPTLKQSCLTHDSWFRVLGAQPFPPYGQLPPHRHVGQNDWVLQQGKSSSPSAPT